jgi:two-component system, NarL family, response regulator DegU
LQRRDEKMKVLVVDDHKEFRAFFINLLENIEGVSIIGEAKDGEECIEMLEKYSPDLVFMDVEMPKMNGIETTKKSINLYRDLKIVAISAYDDFVLIQSMIEAGARNFLTKSKISLEILKKTLQDSN